MKTNKWDAASAHRAGAQQPISPQMFQPTGPSMPDCQSSPAMNLCFYFLKLALKQCAQFEECRLLWFKDYNLQGRSSQDQHFDFPQNVLERFQDWSSGLLVAGGTAAHLLTGRSVGLWLLPVCMSNNSGQNTWERAGVIELFGQRNEACLEEYMWE